ncbi:hypothetical protein HDU93_005147 [Gonapodya sp. JEL0774]|nr:hypothetical protein HDU93_005147 [Gonapodya sp. JEL0774]
MPVVRQATCLESLLPKTDIASQLPTALPLDLSEWNYLLTAYSRANSLIYSTAYLRDIEVLLRSSLGADFGNRVFTKGERTKSPWAPQQRREADEGNDEELADEHVHVHRDGQAQEEHEPHVAQDRSALLLPFRYPSPLPAFILLPYRLYLTHLLCLPHPSALLYPMTTLLSYAATRPVLWMMWCRDTHVAGLVAAVFARTASWDYEKAVWWARRMVRGLERDGEQRESREGGQGEPYEDDVRIGEGRENQVHSASKGSSVNLTNAAASRSSVPGQTSTATPLRLPASLAATLLLYHAKTHRAYYAPSASTWAGSVWPNSAKANLGPLRWNTESVSTVPSPPSSSSPEFMISMLMSHPAMALAGNGSGAGAATVQTQGDLSHQTTVPTLLKAPSRSVQPAHPPTRTPTPNQNALFLVLHLNTLLSRHVSLERHLRPFRFHHPAQSRTNAPPPLPPALCTSLALFYSQFNSRSADKWAARVVEEYPGTEWSDAAGESGARAWGRSGWPRRAESWVDGRRRTVPGGTVTAVAEVVEGWVSAVERSLAGRKVVLWLAEPDEREMRFADEKRMSNRDMMERAEWWLKRMDNGTASGGGLAGMLARVANVHRASLAGASQARQGGDAGRGYVDMLAVRRVAEGWMLLGDERRAREIVMWGEARGGKGVLGAYGKAGLCGRWRVGGDLEAVRCCRGEEVRWWEGVNGFVFGWGEQAGTGRQRRSVSHEGDHADWENDVPALY